MFSGCDRLAEVDIPPNVTSIGRYAFSGCNQLRFIDLPDAFVRIDSQAFYGCENLSVITLPQMLEHLGDEGGGGLTARVPSGGGFLQL